MRACLAASPLVARFLAAPSTAQVERAGLRTLRQLCLLLALALAWSFAVAPVAVAATAAAPRPLAPALRLPTPADVGRMLRDDARRQARQALLQREMLAAVTAPGDARPLPDDAPHPAPAVRPALTLLDEVGRMARPVTVAQVAAWKAEMNAGHPPAVRAALLHLWLGEVALAHDQQPERARWHFRMARLLTRPQTPVYGLAAYDDATALDAEGAYSASADAFHALLLPRTALPGYDHRTCALWWRHARACAGYHAEHARLGIPEPPRLDPLCGAASLAASLQALHLPFDRKTLLAACRVSGEGSDLGDLVAAGPRLGVAVRAVAADDQGLMALPKPLVAYVEHDHFVSVVRADRAGVAYLCSDCGPWPGGEVDLTWAQWHTMNPGLYAAVTRPGTAWDRTLAVALGPGPRPAEADPPMRLATVASLSGLGLSRPRVLTALLPLLRGHVSRYVSPTNPGCGNKPESQHCPPYYLCCWDCYEKAMNGGPSDGDPVNLATGEEEYKPAPDLTVYNPLGPSVTWQRFYNSMRNTGDTAGTGWSNSYDVNITTPLVSQSYDPPPVPATINLPNGAAIPTGGIPYDGLLTYGGAPPPARITLGGGVPMVLICNYAASNSPLVSLPGSVPHAERRKANLCQQRAPTQVYVASFVLIHPDRSRWTFSPSGYLNEGTSAQLQNYSLTKITDRNGNSITFNYNGSSLSSITNSAGTKLLTVSYDGNGNLASVTDCYGRGVYYSVQAFANQNVPSGYPQSEYELTQVSQAVPTGTGSPPSRWAYGYQNVYNGDPGTGNGGETIPALHTLTVPSPTGSGVSMATINYATDGTSVVSSLVDGNGNTRAYTATSGTVTKVTVSNKAGSVLYTYLANFGSNLSQGTKTDGNGVVVYSPAYNSANDPYQPSAITDALGNTWTYTYDTLGNVLTETPPSKSAGTTGSGVTSTRTPATTTYTYSYPTSANLPISTGELDTVQVGSKTATTYAYYEPSGLVQTVTGPQPGLAGSAAIVLSAYVYDGLGNVTSVTAPGPNSTPAATTGSSGFSTYVTTTLGYTADGSYNQSDCIGEPLVVTDPLGHATHFRYLESVPYSTSAINRGHAVSVIDALGYETDATFNIDDRPVTTVYPATGQSGSGRGSTDDVYLYDESGDTTGQEQYGPLASVKTYDEGNTAGAFRQVNYAYGPEGETLGVSGSTEPVTYTYDALYRLTALADGGGIKDTTRYFYNTAGYLYQTAYPLSGASTAPLAAGAADTVTYTGYDLAGDVTARVDGNGTTTAYTYNDPEVLLTDVHYTLPAKAPSYISALADTTYAYDAYGRRQQMADATGTQAYTYGDDDSLLSDTTTYTGLPAEAVSYTYDPDGSRASMATPAGGFGYTYDSAGRETGLSNPAG